MNSLSIIGSLRLWAMKSKASAVILLVLLAFSAVFLSCDKEQEIFESEPDPTFSVSGSIVGENPEIPVEGITLLLDGLYISDTFTCVTGPNGEYCFADVEEAKYDIIPVEGLDSMYFFLPESLKVTLFKDITVSNFTAFEYSRLFVENNSSKNISSVRLSRYARPQVWTDNLLSNDLAPYSISDRIKLTFGTWLLEVTWAEGLNTGVDMISTGHINSGDSLIFPLQYAMKVENNSSAILFSMIMARVFAFEGVTMKMSSGEMLETPVLPGTETEDIYVWPGLYEIECGYYAGSDTNFVTYEDYTISPGDTVLFLFE
ncbi:hypothetical protein ACFL5K_02680 [Gemmatimonadota bacterium]